MSKPSQADKIRRNPTEIPTKSDEIPAKSQQNLTKADDIPTKSRRNLTKSERIPTKPDEIRTSLGQRLVLLRGGTPPSL